MVLLYVKLIEHLIVFLSKRLSPAERNYWVTELSIGALVWGISKLRHYLDGDSFAVFKSFLIHALFLGRWCHTRLADLSLPV